MKFENTDPDPVTWKP